MYVSWSVFLSDFSVNALIGFRQYCLWLSVYRSVSWSAFRFIFLSICLSIRVYNRLILRVYVRHFTRVSLSLFSLNVYTSVRMYYRSFVVYMYVSWSVFLSLFFSDCLYLCLAILSLIVCIFRVFVYLSIPLSLSVSGYITDCMWIGTCFDPRFSLSLCLSV